MELHNHHPRRKFIRNFTVAGLGLGIGGNTVAQSSDELLYGSSLKNPTTEHQRVGIIGLDTSHSLVFTESLNNVKGKPGLLGYRVTHAYPYGSRDIESSASRIPDYIERIKKMGVQIAGSIDELLSKVDVVLLETNDGRLHLEQSIPVLQSGKKVFIDKPMAASLADVVAIFDLSEKYNTPVFSSSSLRFSYGLDDVGSGNRIGKILGADVYSSCELEKTHPDLFWYGIHGVEMLFTLMGTGCKKVSRVHSQGTDIVTGTWDEDRVGTFRGIRVGAAGYGGNAFGEKGIAVLPPYAGYGPLLVQIIHFFRTGVPPVCRQETIEIFAFMEAADQSKRQGGAAVNIETVIKKAHVK